MKGKHPNSKANLKPFEKGVSGNPSGRAIAYKGLEKELNDSLNSLGQHLTALSERFVDDYRPLTEKLSKVVKMSEGIEAYGS